MTALAIDVVSDVVCPWCFIGKRRLEAALRLLRAERPEVVPTVRWQPFFLDPDTPEAGEPYRPYLERKFGGAQRLADIWAQIAAAGHELGIAFAFERIARRANTLRAHRLIRRAQRRAGRGGAEALVERLFAAHFEQGECVGDADVLARLAAECGEDAAAVRAYLASDEDAAAVREAAAQAARLGITGVPFFILDGQLGVGGAQPPAVLLAAMRQALDGTGVSPAGRG